MISIRNNYVWINFARVLGSFSVIALHLSAVLVVGFDNVGSESWWFANIIDSATRWAVPVFVMISGYLLLDPGKQDTLGMFFKKRFLKVGIPLVAWSAIFFWWGYYFYKIPVSTEIITQKMLYGMPYFHLYFLFIMVGLYLITPILKIYLINASRSNLRYFLIISFSIPLLLTFFNHWYPTGSIGVNAITFFCMYISYFLAGYYIKDIRLQKAKFLIALFILMLLIGFTSFATFITVKEFAPSPQWQYFYEYFSPNVVLMSLLIFIIFNSLNSIILRLELIQKVTNIIAPCTFGIYLIHPIIDNILQSGMLGYSINIFTPNPFEGLLVTITVVFIVSFVVTYIAKKIPLLKNIFG